MNLNFTMLSATQVPMLFAAAHDSPTALLDLITRYRSTVIEQLNEYGGVLFRGFACQDLEYFSKAIDLCGLGSRCSTKDYDLPRTVLANEIYTSSDLPGSIPLPLHHEKPRSKNPPRHLYFCCLTPAEQGGGTLFANAEAIWLDMPEHIREKILEHGVLYKQFLHSKSVKYYLIKRILGSNSARSWSDYFATDEKIQIEKKLSEDNLNWAWVNKAKDLIILNYLPGARKHPLTNKLTWFNASAYLNYYTNLIYAKLKELGAYKSLASRYLIAKDMLPLVCHYGNGLAFSSEDIAEITRVLEHHTFTLHWEKGDFMIVDNFTLMHGKQAHKGKRLLYSCMTA